MNGFNCSRFPPTEMQRTSQGWLKTNAYNAAEYLNWRTQNIFEAE